MTQPCLFCGAEVREDDHWVTCDGRQGQVEAALPEYVPATHVRTTDPDTSHAAAESVVATEVQRRVLQLHQRHAETGLTDEQLRDLYEREWRTAESSPRSRRCDLARAGWLVDTGQRRPLQSGRNGIVWRVAETGSGE